VGHHQLRGGRKTIRHLGGQPGDVPVPGDYDGDGTTTWYLAAQQRT
jgi:hypothetical protein